MKKINKRNSLNRRNALKKILGAAGAALLPAYSQAQVRILPNGQGTAIDGRDYVREHWEDIHPESHREVGSINGKAKLKGGLEIECDGETTVYHNDGSARKSTIPYVSLGNKDNNYMLTFAVPSGRKLSVNITKDSEFGGLETKYGDLTFNIRDYASVNIQDQSRNNLVPLVKTVGLVEIVSDKFFVGVGDENRDGQLEVDIVHYFTVPEKFSPPFHFCPYDKKMKPIEQGGSYFTDYYGKIWKVNSTLLGIRGKDNPVEIYSFDRLKGNKEPAVYIPTLAFAALRDKEKFWSNTPYWKQVELGNASLDVLKRYAR